MLIAVVFCFLLFCLSLWGVSGHYSMKGRFVFIRVDELQYMVVKW